jgi:hypothetical protein
MLIGSLHSVFLSDPDAKDKHLEQKTPNLPLQSAVVKNKSGASPHQQLTDIEQICFSANEELQAFCPVILFSKNSPEHRSVGLTLLHGPEYSPSIRQAVLTHYGIDFDSDAINVLYTVVQAKKDPLRNAAINKLFSFNSVSLIEFANKITNNASEDSDIRFQAIEFLVRQGHPEAQEILYH